MLIISNEDVEKVLSMRMSIEIMEDGFRDVAAGDGVDTGRSDVYTATSQHGLFGRLGILRSANRRKHIVALRILSDMASWPEVEGIKTEEKYCVQPGLFCGLLMLFNTENGEPLAFMHDGFLQHLTVGAGAGISAKYLAKKDSHTLGVIGSGGQARTLTDAVCAVRDIRKIKVYSPTPEHRREFADSMSRRHNVDSEVLDNPRGIFSNSDIIITATDSVGPVFDVDWLEAGTHLAFVSGRELDDRIFERADLNSHPFPRSYTARRSEAPLLLIRNFPSWAVATEDELKAIPRRIIPPYPPKKSISLTDIIIGKAKGRMNDEQITVSQSGGPQRFAVVGGAVYELVKAQGLGKEIPTDWFLQTIRD